MKTHKCFKRLSLTSGLVLVLLNTTCAEGKDDWHGTCPKLLCSCHSLEAVSAEGRVGWQCMERQSSEARVLGVWSVLAGRRKRLLWGQTEALLTLCFLIRDLGAGVEALCLKQRKNAEFCPLLLQSLIHRF